MNFCLLPFEVIIEIFMFLPPLQILSLERTCKTFQECINQYKSQLQNFFFYCYRLFPFSNMLYWKKILKRMILCDYKIDLFLPYYVDGGVCLNSHKYFINHLITPKGGRYRSTKNENVLVKYAYKANQLFEYLMPNNYRITEDVYYIRGIENFSENYGKCPFIEKIYIGLPYGPTCALSFAMFFYSFDKNEPENIISKFHSCFSKHKAVSKAKKLGFACSYQKTKYLTMIYFKNFKQGINPLCWLQIKCDDFISPEKFVIKLPEGVFARYFYALLIKGENNPRGSEIDISILTPICKEINLQSKNLKN